jgi:hypothetical protein
MATDQNGPFLSFPADVDLSASQYCLVTLNGDGELALPAAGAKFVLGSLYNKPAAAGRAGNVKRDGTIKVKAINTCTAGGPLKVDAAGKVLNAVATDHAIAIACESGVAGDIIEVVLTGGYIV